MRRKILILMVFMFCVGCASDSKYLAKHALINPAEGISVVHPVELERSGLKSITTFVGIMEPGLWAEVIDVGGVWPTLALTPEKEILKGYCFLVDVNYWGDFLLQFVFYHSLEELNQAKILYFNRDSGWAYRLDGREAKDELEPEDKKKIIYNPRKFDDDNEYQTELFAKFGMTLSELDFSWTNYLEKKGISTKNVSSVHEIIIGSPEWSKFKKKMASIMKYNYKMSDGKIRTGYLPIEEFRQVAVEIPGFNTGQRYLKRARIGLSFIPSIAGLLACVAGDAIAAAIDDSWSGSYARAKTLRYKMAPLFRQICLIYKNLLADRDKKIRLLQRNLMFYKIIKGGEK